MPETRGTRDAGCGTRDARTTAVRRVVPFLPASRVPRPASRVPRSSSRLAALLLCAAAACEFDAGIAPPIKPRLVVHAVLNPLAVDQIVLLEETRASGAGGASGAVGLPADPATDSLDPIRARGGLAVSGAEVVLFGPGGDSAVAVEDAAARGDGLGAGVYRVRNGPLGSGALPVLTGATYRLRVRSPLGTATGETTVPRGLAAGFRPDSCTTRLDVWAASLTFGPGIAASGGPVYLTRAEAQDGSSLYFTAGLPRVSISGAGPRVFVSSSGPQGSTRLQAIAWALPPGFRQSIVVAAVDTNFRNYYGELVEDPFGSDTRASSIRGGVGLFGSAVLLAARTVELFSSAEETIVGQYAIETAHPDLPDRLDIYVNAPWATTPADSLKSFSGRYEFADGRVGAITGSAVESDIALTLHEGRTADAFGRRLLAFGDATFDPQRITARIGATTIVYRKIRQTPLRPPAGTCRV